MTRTPVLAVILVLLTVPLVGCIGAIEDEPDAEAIQEQSQEGVPPIELPDQITGFEELVSIETDGGGTGIWIDEARDLLLSANGGAGFQLYDIQDPENASLVGSLSVDMEGEDLYARDVDLLHVDGDPLAVLAAGSAIHVVDITDPREPVLLATADEHTAHNVAAVPGTPYVYSSTGVGLQGKLSNPVVPVLDLSTPSEPIWHEIPIPATVNGLPVQSDGCHDITVRMDLGMAYCAGGGTWYRNGGGESFIWDIHQDPLTPDWVGIIDNPSIIYHHQALASHDGDLLFINDEHIESNCHRVDAGPASVGQTTAAMWAYDISDPSNPELLSWVQADGPEDLETNCGSHFGDLVEDRDVLVWGWYAGGILLIDVGDPSNPVILDQVPPDGSTWDARYHAGHVYGSSGNVQVLGLA